MKIAVWIVAPSLAVLMLATGHAVAAAALAPQTAVERTKEDGEKTKNVVVKDAKIAVNKTKDGLSKTGEVMTDAWITGHVHERFIGEDLLKDSDINVDTNRHVVTLRGTVTGRAGRARATTVARRTEGVRLVVNRLTIKQKRRD